MRFETQFRLCLNLDFFLSLFMILQQAELNIISHLAIFSNPVFFFYFFILFFCSLRMHSPVCVYLCLTRHFSFLQFQFQVLISLNSLKLFYSSQNILGLDQFLLCFHMLKLIYLNTFLSHLCHFWCKTVLTSTTFQTCYCYTNALLFIRKLALKSPKITWALFCFFFCLLLIFSPFLFNSNPFLLSHFFSSVSPHCNSLSYLSPCFFFHIQELSLYVMAYRFLACIWAFLFLSASFMFPWQSYITLERQYLLQIMP